MESRQRTQLQQEDSAERSADVSESKREEQGCLLSIAQHSYWFDIWIFLLFDLVLFIFIYLLP